ncbi:MAG TPA: DUF192 domain-containing protein [Polyangia bacterium]|nr:DUF192 domain-containing protein [Polyangia bacterium]
MISRRTNLRLAPLLLAAVLAGGACKNSAGQRQTASAGPSEAAASTVVVDTGERQITFRVELARTEPEREKGLMFRDKLAPDAGMLFLFERPSVQTFWMKNTLIPLDMIFIGADRTIVGVVADAQPLTLTARSVGEPSQYVLEIGGGLAARLGIHGGARVEFHGVDPL